VPHALLRYQTMSDPSVHKCTDNALAT
jgi:hypothetical protein